MLSVHDPKGSRYNRIGYKFDEKKEEDVLETGHRVRDLPERKIFLKNIISCTDIF